MLQLVGRRRQDTNTLTTSNASWHRAAACPASRCRRARASAAGIQRLLDLLARCAVDVAMHLGVFEQFVGIAHRLEAALRDESIMHAVDLARAALTRRHRHREADVLLPAPAGCGLAWRRARTWTSITGPRLQMERSLDILHLLAESSTTVLSSSPMFVSSTSRSTSRTELVLLSRLSSCDRKMSLRPIGPPGS